MKKYYQIIYHTIEYGGKDGTDVYLLTKTKNFDWKTDILIYVSSHNIKEYKMYEITETKKEIHF